MKRLKTWLGVITTMVGIWIFRLGRKFAKKEVDRLFVQSLHETGWFHVDDIRNIMAAQESDELIQ